MKQVIVDIEPDGSLSIDAKGFSGAACEEATAFLEDALGTIAERRHKPEYRQATTQAHSNQQRLGGR